MKILHLFDLYLPPTLNWVWELMQATPQAEQWVAAPWFLNNAYLSPEFRVFIRPVQRLSGCLPPDEWQGAWLSATLIRLERHWPLYKNSLFRQLKADKPDVIHAHFGPVGVHYMDLAARLGIPLVTSFYGYDYERLPFQKPAYRAHYRQLFQQAAVLTTTGTWTPELLVKQSCPREKIRPLPVSILPEAFPFQQRNKVPGRLRLVQIATITAKKGHLDTLEAFRRALTDCPGMELCLVGERQDKALFRRLQQFITHQGLTPSVRLLDFIPHDQVSDFLKDFDVFIHPSKTTPLRDREGAPVAIFEALSSGLPVISTLHSDIPQQVLHGQNGLLSAEGDPAQLAAHIARFYHMGNQEYQKMSQAAHSHVAQHFDVKKTAQQLSTIYSAIVSS